MKRMLIGTSHGVRVAIVDGQKLINVEVERNKSTVNSVYLGRVNRVEPSLGAAFVDYGSTRDGFLPSKEISSEYFKENYKIGRGERLNIREALQPGQEIIVQVVKEERGNKGAAIRTFISLAGRYLVLMPNNPRAGGISRQIEGDDRSQLKDNLDQLKMPKGMGLIVRTAGVGKSLEELQWDLDVLLNQWKEIKKAAKGRPAPFLIHQEGDVITRALRDNLRSDIGEILIDCKESFEKAKEHIQHTRPEFLDKIKFYSDPDPLFSRYQIEAQIESAFQREVGLDNGASIVIDPTEALTAIDINSAKATEGSDIEETALNTNLAAASEIARQLRLRDLGGLIVIDFIDMSNPKHQREVERRLDEELKLDKARVQTGRISRFGLLEMSRQRLQPSLGDANQVTCPRCDGQGSIRGVESLTTSILRVIEEETLKPQTAQIQAQVPVEVGTFLINEKRETLMDLEKRHGVQIVVISNKDIQTPHYEITRVKMGDLSHSSASYTMVKEVTTNQLPYKPTSEQPQEKPAVSGLSTSTPPAPKISKESSLIRRLWSAVFGSSEKEVESVKPKPKNKGGSRNQRHQNNRRRGGGGQDRSNNQRQDNRRGNRRGGKNNNQRGRNRNRDYQKDESQKDLQAKDNVTPIADAKSSNVSAQKNAANDGQKGRGRRRNQKGQNQQHQSRQDNNVKHDANVKSFDEPRAPSKEEQRFHEQQMKEQHRANKQPVVEQETFEVPSTSPEVVKESSQAAKAIVESVKSDDKSDKGESAKKTAVVQIPKPKRKPRVKRPVDPRRNRTGFFILSDEQESAARVESIKEEEYRQITSENLTQVISANASEHHATPAPLSALAQSYRSGAAVAVEPEPTPIIETAGAEK